MESTVGGNGGWEVILYRGRWQSSQAPRGNKVFGEETGRRRSELDPGLWFSRGTNFCKKTAKKYKQATHSLGCSSGLQVPSTGKGAGDQLGALSHTGREDGKARRGSLAWVVAQCVGEQTNCMQPDLAQCRTARERQRLGLDGKPIAALCVSAVLRPAAKDKKSSAGT